MKSSAKINNYPGGKLRSVNNANFRFGCIGVSHIWNTFIPGKDYRLSRTSYKCYIELYLGQWKHILQYEHAAKVNISCLSVCIYVFIKCMAQIRRLSYKINITLTLYLREHLLIISREQEPEQRVSVRTPQRPAPSPPKPLH